MDVVSSPTHRRIVCEHKRQLVSIYQSANRWAQNTNKTPSENIPNNRDDICYPLFSLPVPTHCLVVSFSFFFLAMQRGPAPFQLYSLATPNGWKVAILLEELGIDYDAHIVNIGAGEQFSAGFGTFYSILSCHRCFICEHSVLQWVPHRIARSPL